MRYEFSWMRVIGLWIVLLAVASGLAACGGGDDAGKGTGSPPAVSKSARAAVAELKYCVEGAGGYTAKPDGAHSAPEVKDAEPALVIFWTETNDSAYVYYMADDAAAEAAQRRLGSDVRQKGSLIIVPDSDHPPSPDDEGLLLDDCLL
jgi:hypothetical protein